MLGNDSHQWLHFLAGKYPNRVGWLVAPTTPGCKKKREWLPYAFDNGAWGAFVAGEPWDEKPFFTMLDENAEDLSDAANVRDRKEYSISGEKLLPRWVAVPDVVADKEKTLEKWDQFAPRLKEFGIPLAFVAQDGMTPADVPEGAEVVFLGGSHKWKWRNAETFCSLFPRVHIGRVNSVAKLRRAEQFGAESVDGTGWVRAGERRDGWRGVELFLSGEPDPQLDLF